MHIRVWSNLVAILLAGLASGLVVASEPSQEQAKGRKVQPAKAAEKTKHTVPAWAYEARWYYVVVSRFHNGDPSNDPAGTLQGLQRCLPYLKELGVNALYLTPIFHGCAEGPSGKIDLRHIDDSVGVKGSLAQVKEETSEAKTWRFSASDRVFLDLLKEAHKLEIRVVLEGSFPQAARALGTGADAEKYLLEITQRWLDPDGDGDPSDGVDGWVVRAPAQLPHDFWKRWRKHAKGISPKALLIGDVAGDPKPWLTGDAFDVAMNDEASEAIKRFLKPGNRTYTLKQFVADLTTIARRHPLDTVLAAPTSLSGPETGHLLSALSPPVSAPDKTHPQASFKPSDDTWARWRLATVLQCFYLGAPMIYYGDADYRNDFASLIKWLNIRREIHAPLRRGDFRPVMVDEKRRLFAFARSLPGDEVILVMNYGGSKQEVILQVGRPGQLVGLLSPRLDPPPQQPLRKPPSPQGTKPIKPLRMGGSRQYVDTGGHIRLWVKPMSIRVVLVKDKPPW